MRVGHVSSHGVIFLQHWRKLAKHEGEPWPVGRHGHAAVCLGPEHLDPERLFREVERGEFNTNILCIEDVLIKEHSC